MVVPECFIFVHVLDYIACILIVQITYRIKNKQAKKGVPWLVFYVSSVSFNGTMTSYNCISSRESRFVLGIFCFRVQMYCTYKCLVTFYTIALISYHTIELKLSN